MAINESPVSVAVNDEIQGLRGHLATGAVKSTNVVYREIPGFESEGLNLLQQLNANINKLEDLHGRLRFALGEIQSCMKSK